MTKRAGDPVANQLRKRIANLENRREAIDDEITKLRRILKAVTDDADTLDLGKVLSS